MDLQQRPDWVRYAFMIELYDRNWKAALALLQPLGNELTYEQSHVLSRSLLEGLVYRYSGRSEEARTAFLDAQAKLEAGMADHPGDARFHSALGIVHAGLGHREDARREAKKAVELHPTSRDHVAGPLREIDLSVVLALIGDVEPAIDVIEQILQRPAWFSVNQMKLDPAYDSLRNHPRFVALVEKDYPPF